MKNWKVKIISTMFLQPFGNLTNIMFISLNFKVNYSKNCLTNLTFTKKLKTLHFKSNSAQKSVFSKKINSNTIYG